MRVTLLTIIIALLSACSGEKGKIILKGELNGLRQGALLVWNNDGLGSGKVDTINIERGQFEYEAPAGQEVSSWTLVYPNMSTLTFFGASKDVLHLKGQANELRRVEVTGTPDNELYTALRQGKLSPDSLITAHPTSAVARHVLRTEFIDNDNADRKNRARLYQMMREANPSDSVLASWHIWAQAKAPLTIGKRIPHFSVITCDGDTINDSTFMGSHLLIGVWLSTEVKSRSMLKSFRDTRRAVKAQKGKKGNKAKDKEEISKGSKGTMSKDSKAPKANLKDWNGKLELLTINVDFDPKTRATFERLDSIDWHRVNTGRMFDHPLLRSWNIETAPYIIMVDTAGIVRAMGTDFDRDIKPKL